MKPAHQSEQRVSSLEEKLFLSRYSNSQLDDIDADFSIIRPTMPPHGVWRGCWARRHRAARVRRARLAMMVKATNDCAAASSSTETIDEKITIMLRVQRPFERQVPSTMNLCARALRHARVLRGMRSMWIATPGTSFLALSPHAAL